MKEEKINKANKLINEKSPYLLQHAYNPVNWFPWCEEAFEKAKLESKPIFLSIGYSTCHWCHVMAHESFEDTQTAEILNKSFISIKVDREERPDIDSVYMSVCQIFTGSGGWPMSIFMTADKKPFLAGTYFPINSGYGLMGFKDLLNSIINLWGKERNKLIQSADKIINNVNITNNVNIMNNVHKQESVKNITDSEKLIKKAVENLLSSFDNVYGGFGNAPKFPTPHNLLFLTLYAKQLKNNSVYEVVDKTLMQMRKGGIFDHIGYGFSRYSTDKYFLAPHFEKMLYDNALLIIAYAAAYTEWGKEVYLDTSEKTAEYVLREMTSNEGGFYCAQDADSEGIEGKYYTFLLDEIKEVLGNNKGNEFAKIFDVTKEGNFEKTNILNLLKSNDLSGEFDDEIKKLYEYRKKRAELHLDDKMLTSWNSLMIIAMSVLYRVSKKGEYLRAAENANDFITKNLCDNIKIYTSYRNGKRSENGFLDDYAFYIASLIELYNSTLNNTYLERAENICMETIRKFYDKENGGFFLCEFGNRELFMNPKETYDGAIPSGNSVMAYNFIRLYQLTEKADYNELAKKQIDFMSCNAQYYPSGNSFFLFALLIYENPPKSIKIILKDKEKYILPQDKLSILANVILLSESKKYPLLNNKTTYYVCENYACLPPTVE